jgi:UDP-N-acetylmuramate dehydrogenase
MEDVEKILQDVINSKNILKNEPMSKHTSFKIGGIADYYIVVNSVQELKNVLKIAESNKIPITIVGNGTNLLVREGGIRGFVIKLNLNNFKIKRSSSEIQLTVESGMSLATLALIATKEEISGLEFLSGIPGTVGGAIRMNAGAYGKEMKDVVVKSRYMTYDGKIKTLNLDEHKFEYRNSVFANLKDVIIIDTTIKGEKGNKEEIENQIKEYSKLRKEKQPLEYPNAGSTFKRKEGYITAKLIDECGLKGYSIGDAEVSIKHAGFIINKGKATANDILNLTQHIKCEVKKKFDVDIELEIIVLGDEK